MTTVTPRGVSASGGERSGECAATADRLQAVVADRRLEPRGDRMREGAKEHDRAFRVDPFSTVEHTQTDGTRDQIVGIHALSIDVAGAPVIGVSA
jgi:hypothetical protein